jgi:hypothetical protein
MARWLSLVPTFVMVVLGQSLHAPVSVTGLVADTSGRPIAKAWIDHAGRHRMSHSTDSSGRFSFVTTSPAVVVRKAGFQSHLLRTNASAEVRITLESAPPVGRCKLSSVPKLLTTEGKDVDYVATYSSVVVKGQKHTLICGRGPNWSLGVPANSDVWASVEFAESMYGHEDDFGLVDASGVLKDRRLWRHLGSLGESCSYKTDDHEVAKIFDCVMEKAFGLITR